MIEGDYKHVYEIKCHFITYGDKWWLAVVVSFGHVCYWGVAIPMEYDEPNNLL